MAATPISQLFEPFYTIVDYRDNRHLDDTTIVKFTIAIYRDNRQYRAPLIYCNFRKIYHRNVTFLFSMVNFSKITKNLSCLLSFMIQCVMIRCFDKQ